MPIKRREKPNGTDTVACPVCGVELKEHGWTRSMPIFHCEGGFALFSRMTLSHLPHHTTVPPHPPCWKCGASMGCVRCAGPLDELICRKCGVLANKAALLSRGLLPGQRIDDYPARWHREFFARGFMPVFPMAADALLRLSASLISASSRQKSSPTTDSGKIREARSDREEAVESPALKMHSGSDPDERADALGTLKSR